MANLKNSISYLMLTGRDCGFRAQLFSLFPFGIDEAKLYSVRRWPDYDDFRDDIMDSHWHNFEALERLKIKYEIITVEMLFAGQGVKNNTIILLHGKNDPYTAQHWVVFKNIDEKYVYVHYGNGHEKVFTRADFKSAVNTGWPTIIYNIGRGESKLNWLPLQYVKITKKILGKDQPCQIQSL